MNLQLQPVELTPLVAQVLNQPTVEILDWHCAPLVSAGSNYAGGVGLYRVAGTARDQEGNHTWSLIVKIASGASPSAGRDPASRNYWRREAVAYQSGLLAQLPGGRLVAPRCFAVQERGQAECWLWLEDIQSAPAAWDKERYAQVARHLGQFNGAYLAGQPLPAAQPWMTRGRTRVWLEFAHTCIAKLHQYAEAPLVQRWFGQDGVARILKLWGQCEPLLVVFDRLPICYCHHDAHRRNLLVRHRQGGTDETVAIDWALTGFGRIGEEAGVTLAVGLELLDIAASQAQAFDQAIFAGYVTGLHDAGWTGDVRLARLGYTVNAALSTVLGNFYFLEAMQTAEGISFLETAICHPLAHLIDHWSQTLPFSLDRGDEALALAAQLNK